MINAIPLGDSPYATPYDVVGVEECENFYIEKAISTNSKVPYYYISRGGLRSFSPKSTNSTSRGMYRTANERLFCVFGNQVIEILANGQRTTRGSLTTYTGTVSISDNSYQLMIVDGAYGYILDFATNIFTQIDQETFQNGATHVTCIDTYFIVNRPNSMQYNWSSPNNGLLWDPLDFATKQGIPDDIVALKEAQNQLWVFGSYSTEVHYNTGDTETQVWQRYEGAVIDVGCSSPHSVQTIENHIYWLGNDKTGNAAVWSNDGLIPVKISTRGIEQLIGNLSLSNAIGYVYSQYGHVFYVLTFPGSDYTLVWDITTRTWHRRTSRNRLTDNNDRWRAQYSAYAFGKNLFCDNNSDMIYESDMEYYVDDLPEGDTVNIYRIKSTPIYQSNQKKIRWNNIQIIFEQGTGLEINGPDGNGRNPMVLLETSDDSGRVFNLNRRFAEIGRTGITRFRSRFLKLGHSRNRAYRITVSDPIKVVLAGIIADMEELRN